jgi:hypothetical protein
MMVANPPGKQGGFGSGDDQKPEEPEEEEE